MHEVSEELQMQEYQHLCNIARCAHPAIQHESFLKILEFFHYHGNEPKKEQVPVPVLQASSDAARYAVMAAFAKDRRIH